MKGGWLVLRSHPSQATPQFQPVGKKCLKELDNSMELSIPN